VAEGARLESVYTGNRIVGSNPTPSASKPKKIQIFRSYLNACLFLCPSGELQLPLIGRRGW
jgi:hypothetical protein